MKVLTETCGLYKKSRNRLADYIKKSGHILGCDEKSKIWAMPYKTRQFVGHAAVIPTKVVLS